MAFHFRNRPGFTFVEISVVLLITGILFTIVLANYRRANQDSLLQRETSLLMSRIRLAQELTAAGEITKYCTHTTGRACQEDADCVISGVPYPCCPGSGGCPADGGTGHPYGGYALAFSCQTSAFDSLNPDPSGNPYTYPLFSKGDVMYGLFGDSKKCSLGFDNCYPPITWGFDYDPPELEQDGIISHMLYDDAEPDTAKGDVRPVWYELDKKVEINDIRLTTYGSQSYSCGQDSPWLGKAVYGFTDAGEEFSTNDIAPLGYPIQLGIRFLPPDGRKIMLTDNVSSYPPDGSGKPDRTNPWSVGELMLALKDRPNTDCRVVKVTANNVVTQYVDADCNFAT